MLKVEVYLQYGVWISLLYPTCQQPFSPTIDPLMLPHVEYDPLAPEFRDPFFDKPRGGQDKPDANFYSNMKNGKSTPQAYWKTSILMRGFNITARQYIKADNFMRKECVNEHIFEIPDLSTYSAKMHLWKVKRQMIIKFSWARRLLDSENGWWVLDALQGWISKTKDFLKDNDAQLFKRDVQGKFVKLMIEPGLIGRNWGLRKIAACPEPNKDDMVPFKHCYLEFEIPGEAKTRLVPFTAFMTLANAGDDDLAFNTIKIAPLTTEGGPFCVCDVITQEIRYSFTSQMGWSTEDAITSDSDFRTAIMMIWKNDGQRVFKMMVKDMLDGDTVEGRNIQETPAHSAKKRGNGGGSGSGGGSGRQGRAKRTKV